MFELPKTILLVLSSLGIALATFAGDLAGRTEAHRENVVVERTLPDIPVPEPVVVESEVPEVPKEPEPEPEPDIIIEDVMPPEAEGCPFRRHSSRTRYTEHVRSTIWPLFQPHLRGTVHTIRYRHVKRTWLVQGLSYGYDGWSCPVNNQCWDCNGCCRETRGPW